MSPVSDWTFTNTDHGLLVAFGEFLQQHGLLSQLMHVSIPQKTRTHTPQAKLIEFMAGIFSGIEYLWDLNDAPHPLAKDASVAHAWGLPQFAHYSGVSRTLDACDAHTVAAVRRAIVAFSQPFIQSAVHVLLSRGQPLVYDLDLTGQAVSATSTTYPEAAFGWMDHQVQLGYQLARVCLTTATQERIWLTGFHHPGDTVSAACLQELVRAAETQTQVRPRRRTELVQQRIAATQKLLERPRRLLAQQQAKRTELQLAQAQPLQKLPILTARSERLRARMPRGQARLARLAQQLGNCERALTHPQTYLHELTRLIAELKTWLAQLEADHATNPDPPVCEVRMGSGFSGDDNLTWLIEMGSQVNTKAPSDKTTRALRTKASAQTFWTRVGANAELSAPCAYQLHGCPYPLQVTLQRFQIGETYHYATLLQFRDVGTPAPLSDWFSSYNGRQTIEAGNKELKSGVFHIQHVMTHAPAGIQLQVLFAGLAAHAVRWAGPWLRACARRVAPPLEQTLQSPKHIVRVAANAAALVQQTPSGTAIQFAPSSALPGVTLFLKGVPAFQLPLGFQFAVQNHN